MENILSNHVYLDNAAATPIDPRVLDIMCNMLSQNNVGNAHAMHHVYGNNASSIIKNARRQTALSIGAKPDEIIFTSGATETNNLVIKGLFSYLKSIEKTHIITTAIEHKSVLEPIANLKSQGFDVTILPVKPCGMIEANKIEAALTERTGLVSVQAVNNETGTIQPLSEIATMLSAYDIFFHSDAAQALGKMPFSVVSTGVDFASFSAHKVYGPQGIGALYVKGCLLELLEPLQVGGGQELGLRSGTLPTFLCAGFGAACALIEDDRPHLQALRISFMKRIERLKPIIYGHYDPLWNVPGILNIRFEGVDNEALVMALPQLAFGVGSACSSTREKTSHVIEAISGSKQAAKESIRLSFGRFTTQNDMDMAADQLIALVSSIRSLQGVR